MSTLENVQFVIRKSDYDGIGNVIKGYITAFSANPNSKIECNPHYVFGLYDTVLHPRHIFDAATTDKVAYMYTSRILVLKSEEDVQPNYECYENREGAIGHVSGCLEYNYLYSSTVLIDTNYRPEFICPLVKNRILRTIYNIEFLPIIYENVNECIAGLGKNSLGISIRTWNCFHEKNIRRIYSTDDYQEKIKDVLRLHPDIDQLVVSFDNHDYEPEYEDFFNELERGNMKGRSSIYSEASHRNMNIPVKILRKSDYMKGVSEASRTNMNEIQYAFMKMLVLSKSKYFIGNRISTFSELVWWFSDCTTVVHTIY